MKGLKYIFIIHDIYLPSVFRYKPRHSARMEIIFYDIRPIITSNVATEIKIIEVGLKVFEILGQN